MNKYIPIIGLEIHVELKTNSKMFCGCRNDPFHAPKPNIYTCPVCLGLPGALPVPSKKAIELTVTLGLALSCRINKQSRFDRKHYFYPDLPKGYQISQYERPFCAEGKMKIGDIGGIREIRIRRVHLEEDTGKLLHRKINGEEVSLVDFNRSGVPLVEIVTEPDIRSAGEAKAVARRIHRIVRFLGISDADMEKGSMRLEANISMFKGLALPRQGQALPNYKVEVKNINSFRFLERAINQEIDRQAEILSSNKAVKQQTFGWDSEKMELKPQRVKEEAADYRYFPEPDIPPIQLSGSQISDIGSQIGDLPDEVFEKLVGTGVGEAASAVISSNKVLAEKVIGGIGEIREIKMFGNWVVHHQKLAQTATAQELVGMFNKEKAQMVTDEGQLAKWVQQAVTENPKPVADYKNGKQEALQYLIGQVQKLAKGKAVVTRVKKLLIKGLKD